MPRDWAPAITSSLVPASRASSASVTTSTGLRYPHVAALHPRARLGSFSAAARESGLAQPQVSRMIAELVRGCFHAPPEPWFRPKRASNF
ncbi:LysR family transcriptional regulator [Pseudomonas sp. 10B1]|uniref:helix-turn-helix domain-containing protein n=1 Tax=unclassified Pseudomonas TaxID=196821 RepID=UPI002AB59B6B|nr:MULTISPECIES: LysR family transcriptional regulator [unclassified Pseudomonas]MEB0125690.1 LysR family transcriptional regulator [Pseudomonas sp. CCC1.2]MEB0195860.1 LysR family transcriptional regulator [Pseudomonas sp. 5S4]MEB0244830.1 LysR family transcriptional regulator [Pseudomonas sp. 10S5]MEB0309258.1 LysR family transcriptional regulator [Pseudomonas sp. 10B1]MDY7559831.1 LysR family transcriptional regulator [Pseudomonas sp. AB6]